MVGVLLLAGCPGDDDESGTLEDVSDVDGTAADGTDLPGDADSPDIPSTGPDSTDTSDGTGDTSESTEPVQCEAAEDCSHDDLDEELTECTQLACVQNSCELVPVDDGSTCDDESKCTEEDSCLGGECTGGLAIDCADDGNQCTEEVCDPQLGCQSKGLSGSVCDDGNECTDGDGCLNGTCLGGPIDGAKCPEVCDNEEDDNGDNKTDCDDPLCSDELVCKNECVFQEAFLTCDSEPLTIDLGGGGAIGAVKGWPCADGGWPGPEWAYAFTSADAVDATVTLSGEFAGSVQLLVLKDPTNAGCVPSACADAGAEEVTFDVKPGQSNYVVVDTGEKTPSGTVTLTVSCTDCVPSCGAKTCGGDGCGGSCGSCAAGSTCVGGQCVKPPDNDTCADAAIIDPAVLPGFYTSTTAAAKDDAFLPPESGCPGSKDQGMGLGPGDAVHKVTPTEAGEYLIAVDGGFNAVLYIVTDCADIVGSCVAATNTPGASGEKLEVTLDKGITYYVIVDGFAGSSAGDYTLTFNTLPCTPGCGGKACGLDGCGGTCGSCGAGLTCGPDGLCVDKADNDTCAEALLIDAVPYSIDHKTNAASDDYVVLGESCPGGPGVEAGAGAADLVYLFKAPKNGKFQATVTPAGSFDAVLSIQSSCPAGFLDCIYGSDGPGAAVETAEFVLSEGELVYLVVDGASAGQVGSFELTVDAIDCAPQCGGKTCGPDKCGGHCGVCAGEEICTFSGQCALVPPNDTCETATVIDTLPYSFSGDTLGAGADYAVPPSSCTDGPVAATYGAGGDVVFTYTSPVDQKVAFSFDSGLTTFNTFIYALTDCSDLSVFCLAAPDSPVNGAESLVVDMLATQQIFVIVDGWSNGSAGSYTFKAAAFGL